jgi:hypothetical protein
MNVGIAMHWETICTLVVQLAAYSSVITDPERWIELFWCRNLLHQPPDDEVAGREASF